MRVLTSGYQDEESLEDEVSEAKCVKVVVGTAGGKTDHLKAKHPKDTGQT